ncbi:MAG: hypothetical protein AAGE92_16140 [Cyanobacteria bacterium P01_G01_bin.4]
MFWIKSHSIVSAIAPMLIASVAFADKPNIPATVMSEMFLKRCASPILNGQPTIVAGLKSIPEEANLIAGAKPGRVWMSTHAHVSLSEFDVSDKYLGCRVDWHGSAAERHGIAINHDHVIEHFATWVGEQVAQGKLVEIKQCGDRNSEYIHVVESKTERDPPVRIFLSHRREIDFIWLVASEADAQREPEEC